MRPRPSPIFDTLLDSIVRVTLVFSLFLLFAGHNAPGGGFVGGLTAAAALLLRYAAGGERSVDRVLPLPAHVFLGGGVVLATTVGLLGMVWGEVFLESAKLTFDVPLLGTFKATSALPFDVGVYAVVVGLALAILRALGGDTDADADEPRVVPEVHA